MKPTLKDKLGIEYPIFLAPMAGGLVTPEFVAQVSSFGMLGAVPSGYLSLIQIREFVTKVKRHSGKPFSLNLFVDYNVYGTTSIQKPNEILAIERTFDKGCPTSFHVPSTPTMDDLIQLTIDCEVPAVSTTFALLRSTHVDALKDAGILLMTTINSVYELELALETQKPDVLIYQNEQAGGHKGGFTSLPHSDDTTILSAIEQHHDIYCVLAGGIVDKTDIASALNKGFDGVQIGTAFLATQESSANEDYKKAILKNQETAFTTSITGKSARGLKNRLACLDVQTNPGFPYMHYATAGLRKTAKAHGDMDYQSLWCGNGIVRINTLPTLSDFMKGLIS